MNWYDALVHIIKEKQRGTSFVEIDNLKNYVAKISAKAEIINYYSRGNLAGFIAFYANDQNTKIAFLSMLCSRQRKIGEFLLKQSIERCRDLEMVEYHLEVKKENSKAIALYERYGFFVFGEREDFFQMKLIF